LTSKELLSLKIAYDSFNMKQKDILIIIILLFIFVLTWIGESVYRSAVNSTISEATNKDISPIAPVFDTKAIDKLRERQKITPSFELENVTPTPITLPILKTSPQSASQGGKLLL
jgi:hypothetical protein